LSETSYIGAIAVSFRRSAWRSWSSTMR